MAMKNARVVLLAGATGLVGQEILAALLADKTVKAVHCVGRRSPAVKHPRLNTHVVDFSAMPTFAQLDECFIALGTTIKAAGSQAAFRAIDLDAVVTIAQAALSSGASTLGVVSAMGANAQSRVFYNRIKGEMELSLIRMGFKSLVIARPSLLDGDRASLHQPDRPSERLGLLSARALRPLLPVNYRAILAKDVAHALIRAVKVAKPGVATLLSGEMQGG